MLRIFSSLCFFLVSFCAFAQTADYMDESQCRNMARQAVYNYENNFIQSYSATLEELIEENVYYSCVAASRMGVTEKQFSNKRSIICEEKKVFSYFQKTFRIVHIDLEFRRWFEINDSMAQTPKIRSLNLIESLFDYSKIKLSTESHIVLIDSSFKGENKSSSAVLVENTHEKRTFKDITCYDVEALTKNIFI